MKKENSPKGDKREIREKMHLTRPPRLEGKVKNAMMQAVRKPKKALQTKQLSRKSQGTTRKQRKDYQLKGPKH